MLSARVKMFPIAAAAMLAAAAAPLRAQSPEGTSIARAAAARVEPGDRIFLKVWREPEFRDTVMVDEHGDVVLPKIGRLRVSSLTISQLRDTVVHRLSGFLRDPAADVTVLRRVSVNGEVIRPDVYLVDVATTLRDVVALAGGVSPSGDARKVIIVRDGRATPVRNWERDNSRASDLRSGDQVIVGRRSWLALNLMPVAAAAGVVASVALALMR
jgi:protein involved in polysaccharide export with SLBB domain